MNINKTNEVLTIAIKGLSVIALSVGIITGVNTYNSLSHNGPSCSGNASAIQSWYGHTATLVSFNEARLQPKNGETICLGTAKKKTGGYVDYKALITETNRGLIGWAK